MIVRALIWYNNDRTHRRIRFHVTPVKLTPVPNLYLKSLIGGDGSGILGVTSVISFGRGHNIMQYLFLFYVCKYIIFKQTFNGISRKILKN